MTNKTPDDLVERVARAIAKRRGEHWFGSEANEKYNAQWIADAEAAIAALAPERGMREALEAERDQLLATISRIREAIEYADPVSDDLLIQAHGRFSLRETAKRYGVGVGRVRGAWSKTAAKSERK